MRDILTRGLASLGLSEEAAPRLERFAGMVLEKNRVMNLTAITDPAEFATLHLLDSLCLLPYCGNLTEKRLIDVGTGAGFPGMPLAILRPDSDITLLDSLGKRVQFLQDCRTGLALSRVRCVQGRAEEFASEHREVFDLAVSRAVAALPVLLELCLPLIRVGGQFLAMKSNRSDPEILSSNKAVSLLGGQLLAVEDYTIPTTEIRHRVVIVEKSSPTPGKYPRRFAQIKKQPLG